MFLLKPSVSKPSPTANPATWRKGMESGLPRLSPAGALAEASPRRPDMRKTTRLMASHRLGADSAVRVAPSSEPWMARSSPTRRLTGRSSTAWVPSFTRLFFNRLFVRRWPAIASTNRSETPSARTGSQHGGDGESQDLITAAGRSGVALAEPAALRPAWHRPLALPVARRSDFRPAQPADRPVHLRAKSNFKH